jgi:hypothetical protein
MLTLTQPAALWLLLALIALLLVRRIPPRRQQPIATLHLWAGLDQAQQPALSHRLRRHHLALLQAAFIVLLVLALAKPQVALSRLDVALVLDASMSMGATDGARRRIDAAAEQARAIAQSLPNGSRMTVYLAGPDTVSIGTFPAADPSLDDRLRGIELTDASAKLDAAIERARASEPHPARIYVLSDTDAPPSSPDVEWLRIGTPADNAAVTTLTVARDPSEATITILAGATNFGSVDATGDLVIRSDEAPIARRTLLLPAGESASIAMRVPPGAAVISARLERPDALEADNVRFAIVPRAGPIRAHLIGRSPFLEEALGALPGLDVITQGSAEVPDVIICTGCTTLPDEHGRAGVLMLPGGTPSATGLASIVLAAGDHPLLADVNATGGEVLPVESAVPLDPSAVLMRAGGHPVLAAYAVGPRRVVDVRFDPARSPLAVQPAFPLLVAASVSWLTGAHRSTWTAGDALSVEASTITGVTGPDGRALPHRATERAVSVDQTAAAGIYRISTPSGDIPVAVNPDVADESDLTSSMAANAAAPAAAAILATQQLMDLNTLLLLAALGVLAGEWHLRRRGRV